MKINKIIAIASAIILPTVCLSISSENVKTNAEDTSDSTIKIMSIGDSITDGYGTDGSYRKFLYHNLTEAGYSIDMVGPNWSWGDAEYTDETTGESFTYDAAHCGYSGYAIAEYSGRSGIYETIQSGDYLNTYSPDIVILQIGTNDVIDNHELDTAGERLDTLVSYIIENISDDAILFVTTIPDLEPNRDDVYSWFGNYRHSSDWQTTYTDDEVVTMVDAAVDDYNAQVKALIEKKQSEGITNIKFADVNSAITDTTTQLKDGVHPNNVGYESMGNYWTEVISAYLSGSEAVETTENTETTEEITTTEVTTEATESTTEVTETTEDFDTTESTEATETTTEAVTDEPTEATTESESETEISQDTSLLYDVNTDGTISISDAVSLSRYILKSETFTKEQFINADIDENGKVNIIDLAMLKERLLTPEPLYLD